MLYFAPRKSYFFPFSLHFVKNEAVSKFQFWNSNLRATLIKSTLIGDLLILLRKHRIKAALAALAHSRLN
jgi:hypothetical protein